MYRIQTRDLLLLKDNPRKFREIIRGRKRDPLNNNEIVLDLAREYLFSPDNVETTFIIKPKEPEDLKLKHYLEAFASQVSAALYQNPDGIEDIDRLSLEAYRIAGFQDLDLEQVKALASKHTDYFNFYASKESKQIVTEEQVNEGKTLAGIIANKLKISNIIKTYIKDYDTVTCEKLLESVPEWCRPFCKSRYEEMSMPIPEGASDEVRRVFAKRKTSLRVEEAKVLIAPNTHNEIVFGDVEITGISKTTRTSTLILESPVDFIFYDKSKNSLTFTYFDYTEDIKSFPEAFANGLYLNPTSFIYNFTDFLKDDSLKLFHKYVVIDKLGRSYTFNITPKTMEKYTKELVSLLRRHDWHVKNAKWDLPQEYASESVSL
jgi:hypothetical protein